MNECEMTFKSRIIILRSYDDGPAEGQKKFLSYNFLICYIVFKNGNFRLFNFKKNISLLDL